MSNEMINHPVLGLCEKLPINETPKHGDYWVHENGTIMRFDDRISPGVIIYLLDKEVVDVK